MRRGPATRAVASLLPGLVAVLVVPLLTVVGVAEPAAAVDDSGVSLRITGVSPTALSPGDEVTLSGFVTNGGDESWTSAQAYLVVPHSPFTTRQQVSDAVANETSYTGVRVVELDSIDEIGDLAPGDTRAFRVEVPYDDLDITGAEGVYPVGVQVLATAEDGTRSSTAIARATTFMPLIDGDSPAVPGGLVWPFVLPTLTDADGRLTGAAELADRVLPGGQLRNLLDQARTAPAAGTTLVLDPALLTALDDVAEDRNLPDDVALSDEQRSAARQFLTDVVALAQRVPTWILGYDRPDVLAIADSTERDALLTAVDRATTTALAQFQLTGRQVSWPTRTGTRADLLPLLRGGGERPVIVTRSAVPDWEPRLGTVVTRRTGSGPVPLLVDAGLDVGVPGTRTVATLRQRLLSEAAFASLERRGDSTSKADAVVLLDPTWDPGRTSAGAFSSAFDPDYVTPTDLDSLLATERATYEGDVPRTADADPLSRSQVASVEEIVRLSAVLADLVVDTDAVADSTARTVASLLAVGWRKDRTAGADVAEARLADVRSRLEGLSVEGPPAFTLSSSEGSFPLTVSNDTDESVRVGVRIETSNPALDVPDVDPVEVGAGERRTLTVPIDVGDQTSSTFTARLITQNGTTVGGSDSFNVRSSRVGVALWVLMAGAGLFVLFALTRRFLRGRRPGRDELPRGELDD